MKRIGSKDTSIEVRLRKELWSRGIRYRKNFKKLPGSPDIAITKYKIAVFCDTDPSSVFDLSVARAEKTPIPIR